MHPTSTTTTTTNVADDLEVRLSALRHSDRHADAWLLGWMLSRNPEAIADALDAYERIGVRS